MRRFSFKVSAQTARRGLRAERATTSMQAAMGAQTRHLAIDDGEDQRVAARVLTHEAEHQVIRSNLRAASKSGGPGKQIPAR